MRIDSIEKKTRCPTQIKLSSDTQVLGATMARELTQPGKSVIFLSAVSTKYLLSLLVNVYV
jgi:hypothetical protein